MLECPVSVARGCASLLRLPLWWQDPGDTLDAEGVQRLPLPLEGTGGPTYRAIRPSAKLPSELTAPAHLIREMGAALGLRHAQQGAAPLPAACLRLSCHWAFPPLGLTRSGLEGVFPLGPSCLHPLTVGWPSRPACGTYSHQGHQLHPHSETQLKTSDLWMLAWH